MKFLMSNPGQRIESGARMRDLNHNFDEVVWREG